MNNIENYPDILTPKEVAKYFRVSITTIKRWDNRLPVIRVGKRGDRRYRKSDVLKFIGIDK